MCNLFIFSQISVFVCDLSLLLSQSDTGLFIFYTKEASMWSSSAESLSSPYVTVTLKKTLSTGADVGVIKVLIDTACFQDGRWCPLIRRYVRGSIPSFISSTRALYSPDSNCIAMHISLENEGKSLSLRASISSDLAWTGSSIRSSRNNFNDEEIVSLLIDEFRKVSAGSIAFRAASIRLMSSPAH